MKERTIPSSPLKPLLTPRDCYARSGLQKRAFITTIFFFMTMTPSQRGLLLSRGRMAKPRDTEAVSRLVVVPVAEKPLLFRSVGTIYDPGFGHLALLPLTNVKRDTFLVGRKTEVFHNRGT